MVSGGGDGTVKVWRVDNTDELATFHELDGFEGHADLATALSFSPDGALLASGSEDYTVRIWQVDTRRVVRSLTGHLDTVRSVAWSPKSELLASGSDDGTVRVWQVDSGREVRPLWGHQDEVQSVAFSPALSLTTLLLNSWPSSAKTIRQRCEQVERPVCQRCKPFKAFNSGFSGLMMGISRSLFNS